MRENRLGAEAKTQLYSIDVEKYVSVQHTSVLFFLNKMLPFYLFHSYSKGPT